MAGSGISENREAFRRLFVEHRDAVYGFLRRLTRDPHDAEDLLQETFARLWQKRTQFRGEGSLGGYVRRIAYRTYLNARPRIEKVRGQAPLAVDPLDNGAGPAETAAKAELEAYLLARVRQEVDELPDEWREPFVLFRYEGLRCKDIAEIMDITPKAVEIRVAKALKRVAARLSDLRARYKGALPA